jgi:hypothetical protein
MRSIRPPFTVKDEPIENFRPMKVRVIWAGYSGIYLGIRIPQRLRNIDLQIYEKNEGIGGTWWENRYPGCACDIRGKSSKLENFIITSAEDDYDSTLLSVYLRAESLLVGFLRPCS